MTNFIVTLTVKPNNKIFERRFNNSIEIAEYLKAAIIVFGPYLSIEIGKE